jgi:hypothetical protein
MADSRDFKNKNTKFTGTDSIEVPAGTTAERSGTELGQLRYNTDLGFLEQYNATGWAGIDAPPTVGSFSGTIFEAVDSTITILGSNFKSGSQVAITGAAVSGIDRNLSTTFVNSGELTAATNASSVSFVGGASFSIKVINPSGLSAVLEPAGDVDRAPVWTTSAGSLGTVTDGNRSTTFTLVATDPDGSGTITYSVVSGSLPNGASLDSNTGVISGFNAVGSNTTSNFTVRATSSVGSTTQDRAFSITVNAPVIQTFTSNGTFSVPSGVSSVNVLVVAGGGAGHDNNSGGGGAGGLIYRAGFPVSPGGSVPVTVGPGGVGNNANGSNSAFGSLTAIGGGGGTQWAQGLPGNSGGSGGGGSGNPTGTSRAQGGSATQPGQPGDSGTYGFGNSGGAGAHVASGDGGGGGGGGAGGAGGVAPHPGSQPWGNGGNGGIGRQYDISGSNVYYAGGGGGGAGGSPAGNITLAPGGQGGGGTGGAAAYPAGGSPATFYGGGGGGGDNSAPGSGYQGVVIVRY